MEIMMMEAVIENLRQLSREPMVNFRVSWVAENLASALEQMKSLWVHGHDYDPKDDGLVKKLFRKADRLTDLISGGFKDDDPLIKLLCEPDHLADSISGTRERKAPSPNLFLACSLVWESARQQEAASLTGRIELVNTQLLTKIAMAPHPPQGGRDQRAAGDLDGDDDAYDTWKEGYSYLAVDDFVVGREDAIEEVICGLLSDDGKNKDDLKIISIRGMAGMVKQPLLVEEVICGLLSDDGKNKDDLKIISICGMPGIGKTLARKLVHQDYSVRHHFDCIAWATVGKSFSTRHVLEDLLLHHLFLNRDDMNPYSDLDLAQKLYEFLQPKRYLIVLDDVWSIDAWVCFRIAFP